MVSEPTRNDLGGLMQRNIRRTSLQRSEIVRGRQSHADPSFTLPRADLGCAVAAGNPDGLGTQTVTLGVAGDQ